MFALENIELNFSGNLFFFIAGIIIAVFFTYYTYKFTIPQINKPIKIILILLRSLSIILLFLLIFEPIITLKNKINKKPINLIFVDNSRSIKINNEGEKILDYLEGLNNLENVKLFSFGSKINSLSADSLTNIKYNEASTNFENIFKKVEKTDDNISSVTIISDGNITDGLSPINESEELGFPIYTVGIGDTSTNKDVLIQNVSYNKFIYANTPTTISTVIKNKKYNGSKTLVTLYDEEKIIEQKDIVLAEDGINNISFSYKPNKYGERKLEIRAGDLTGEENIVNNSKTFYIKVQKSKLKVLLISGSPSNDLEFIKTALKENKNITVNSITQINRNRFLEKENTNKLLDSADVYFLIGFPSASSNFSFIEKVKNKIINNKIPFLFLLGNADYSKLNYLGNILPFSANLLNNNVNEVLPSIVKDNINSPILQTKRNDVLSVWGKLPPVFQPNINIKLKPATNILSEIIINNVPLKKPLIVSRIMAGQKSIALLAKGFWRWKLLSSANDVDMYDKFISNCVKWLSSSDKEKKVIIKPIKKLFSINEDVEFSAQVYDESFNPVSNADVSLTLINKKNKNSIRINLNSKENGLYNGIFQTIIPGDYSYKGEALLGGKILGKDTGKLNIGETDIELLNTKLNSELLKTISTNSKGRYFSFSQRENLVDLLKKNNRKIINEKTVTSEISLWSNKWILIIIVLLFATEWFLRRRLNLM